MDKDGILHSRYNGGAESYLPTTYRVNHAPCLTELDNGDLLAVWFAGHTEEGRSDIEIVMSRLKAGEAQWSDPVRVSDDDTKSEQNPVLFLAPDGRLLLMYTAQEAAQMSRAEFKSFIRMVHLPVRKQRLFAAESPSTTDGPGDQPALCSRRRDLLPSSYSCG